MRSGDRVARYTGAEVQGLLQLYTPLVYYTITAVQLYYYIDLLVLYGWSSCYGSYY